jgi:hypothetical protein
MSLEHNDIYLLDKSGRTIYFNSMHEVNYDSKIFIFNKTFYKDRLVKIFEENVDKISHNLLNSNFLPSSFNEISTVIESLNFFFSSNLNMFEKNGLNLNDFKKLYESLLENFESSKIIFKSVKINMKICDKIRDNYNFQYNSLESIYKNISVLYEQCYNKYKELESDLHKMNEKNDKILGVYKDSIEKLKSMEIHPKMQTNKERVLLDIYFDESKMNVWKEKCVKSSDFISSKIKDRGEMILAEKIKIRNEKNTNIFQLKNE